MQPPAKGWTHGLVGQSPEMALIRRLIDKASRNRLPVLLLGESGTGKEVVARAIHNAAPQGQFVPIDCGSLVGTLMESELFGHTKGSFSGAAENKKGLVELADGGTAFFDEIGDLPVEVQVKLLCLLQESESRAVGALHWRKVDLRITAATHRDLKAEVQAGRFRRDLYFRLNVFADAFAAAATAQARHPGTGATLHSNRYGDSSARTVPEPGDGDSVRVRPGNVRELRYCIDRTSALHAEGTLQMSDLPTPLQDHRATKGLAGPGGRYRCRA